jgi:WD40 repeat protein
VIAVSKANDANHRRAEAEAAQLVVTVRGTPELTPSAVLQLAVEADRRASTPATQGLLLDAIGDDPGFTSHGEVGSLIPAGNAPTSSNGHVLIGTDANAQGLVFDTATLKRLKQAMQPAPMVVVNTGSRLLGVFGPSLKVVDLNSRATLGRFPDVTARTSDVGLSPDGTLLAAATKADESGSEAGIAVLDVATATKKLSLSSFRNEEVTDVSFGRDDRHVLAVVGGKKVGVWDATTGKELVETTEFDSTVTRTGMSPSEDLIAVGRDNGQLELWRQTESGLWAPRLISFTHQKGIVWIDFDTNGDRMVSTSRDGVAIVWDTETGVAVSRPRAFPGTRGLATFFQPGSSTRLVTIADGHAYEWDALRDGGLVHTVIAVNLSATVAGSPANAVLAATDTTITVYEPSGEAHAVPLDAREERIRGVAASEDGSRFVVVFNDGSLELHDTASGNLVSAWGGERRAVTRPEVKIAIDRDGHRVAYETIYHRIEIVDDNGATHESITLTSTRHELQQLELNDDGSELVISTINGEATWYDIDGVDAARIAPEGTGFDAHFTSDDRVAVIGAGAMQIIDPQLRQATKHVDLGVDARRLAVDATGRLLATVDDDGLIQLWSAERAVSIGDPLRIWSLSGSVPIRFSADGHYLVASGPDSTTWINVWTRDWPVVACSLVSEALSSGERARYLGSIETSTTCG